MTVSQIMGVARNGDMQDRIRYFMIKYAVTVMSEDVGTNLHTVRLAYAKKILSGTASIIEYSIGVFTNGAVAANGIDAPDGDLEFTVNTMYNAFAGANS